MGYNNENTATPFDLEEDVQVQVAAAQPPADVQFDEGDVGRPPKPERPIWFSNANNPVKSREALGVWFRDGFAYKIYGTQNTKVRVKNDLETARKVKLPIGNAECAEGIVATAKPPKYRGKPGFVVKAIDYRGSDWKWFDAQGNGIANFRTLIKSINDRDALQRIQAGLQIAVRLKLADPQGFINAKDGNPIQFVDIHYGSDAKISELLKIVDERVASL